METQQRTDDADIVKALMTPNGTAYYDQIKGWDLSEWMDENLLREYYHHDEPNQHILNQIDQLCRNRRGTRLVSDLGISESVRIPSFADFLLRYH